MKQERARRSTGGRHRLRASEVHEDSRTQRERTRGDAERAALADDLDDLLDEVDSVLEENAQEFVQNYVQKGGE